MSLAEKLYPPTLSASIPAFYEEDGTVTITVPFVMNKTVSPDEVTEFALKIKNIQTNTYITTLYTSPRIHYINSYEEGQLYFGKYDFYEPDFNTLQNEFWRVFIKSQEAFESYDLSGSNKLYFYEDTSYMIDNQIAIFTFSDSDLFFNDILEGSYYKFQLAYKQGNVTGYFSNVAIGKMTVKPTITLDYFLPDGGSVINGWHSKQHGTYETTDPSEGVAYYIFNLYDNQNNLIETSDWQTHNSTLDAIVKEENSSDTEEENSPNVEEENSSKKICQDTYEFITSLKQNEIYKVQYGVKTVDNCEIYTNIDEYQYYQLITQNNQNNPFTLNARIDNENGIVKLSFSQNDIDISSHLDEQVWGIIRRSSERDQFITWQTLVSIHLDKLENLFNDWIFNDFTVEQGIQYKYHFEIYSYNILNDTKVYSYFNMGYANENTPIFVDFEDMFLYDGEKQIKIKFNPKVSSFKETILESKIDTIGSKYPYFFRNQQVGYKEFPISGLISYHMDNDEMFLQKQQYNISDYPNFKQYTLKQYISPLEVLSMWPSNNENTSLYGVYNNNELLLLEKHKNLITECYNPTIINNSHKHLIDQDRTSLQNSIDNYLRLSQEAEDIADKQRYLGLYMMYLNLLDYYEQNIENDENLVNFLKVISQYKFFKILTSLSQREGTFTTQTLPNNMPTTNLESYNIRAEREFKMQLLDWLNNGKIKLFRSPTEGNYLVRLMNVSLTPEDRLGRMLHSFQAQAYEVANLNYQNLLKYNFIQKINENELNYIINLNGCYFGEGQDIEKIFISDDFNYATDIDINNHIINTSKIIDLTIEFSHNENVEEEEDDYITIIYSDNPQTPVNIIITPEILDENNYLDMTQFNVNNIAQIDATNIKNWNSIISFGYIELV